MFVRIPLSSSAVVIVPLALGPQLATSQMLSAQAHGVVLVGGTIQKFASDGTRLVNTFWMDAPELLFIVDFQRDTATTSLAFDAKFIDTLTIKAYAPPAVTLRYERTATCQTGDDAISKQQVDKLARALWRNPMMGRAARIGGMDHLFIQVLPATAAPCLTGRQTSLLDS